MKQEYIDTGKVRLVYRHFPVLGAESVRAAEASECAGEQGRFWEYHDILFENVKGENVGSFSEENLKSFAGVLGLDMEQFNSCLSSRKYLERVRQDFRDGQLLGVQGTPTFLIDGETIRGLQDYEEYRNIIDRLLQEGQ